MGNQSGKISTKEVNFLTMHTIFEKEEIKSFYREFLNNWPDGYMDLQTFTDFLRGFFNGDMESFAEHYFRNIDKDKTGKINFKEFLLYLSSEGSTNPFERITWLFDLFDVDGNGEINKKEMVEIFKNALKLTREDTEDPDSTAATITEEIFQRYDRNKTNTLNKFEFQDAFLERPETFLRFPVLYNYIFNVRIQ